MARLQILNHGKPTMLCLVTDVPMPDGTKRCYCETGRDALAYIYQRIMLDKAFIRQQVRAMSRRISWRMAG